MEPNSNNNNTEAIAGSSDRIGNDGLEMASETIGVSAPETKVEASTGPAPVSENSNASISTAQPTSVLGNGETTGTVPMVTADNKSMDQGVLSAVSVQLPTMEQLTSLSAATVTSSNQPISIPGLSFMVGQQQLTASTTAAIQAPQFFIAGPTAGTPGLPFQQQILIPVNQNMLSSAVQQASAIATGNQMTQISQVPQQYITIPISMPMPMGVGTQPMQLLANQQFLTAANLAGLQPITMISANQTKPEPHQLTTETIETKKTPAEEVSLPATDLNQLVKLLPSMQSLSSKAEATSSGQDELSTSNEHSSGSMNNEILVSYTEPGAIIDGINLDEIKEFAKEFKLRRLSMGLTQTQVGQALSIAEGPAYSQSAICRFEKLDITPKSAVKIKPVLKKWLRETEAEYRMGGLSALGVQGTECTKKRKRRTSFTPQSVEILSGYFNTNTHPSGAEMAVLANKLGYEKEVVRVWFCNRRQALKNASKRFKSDNSESSTATS